MFRGISQNDYESILSNKPLLAPFPRSKLGLTEHILNSGNLETPFISLTSDINAAKKFGIPIIIDITKLNGHLYTPEEIESILKREAKQFWTVQLRLQKKNNEFILGPSKSHLAEIPSDAIINVKRRSVAA